MFRCPTAQHFAATVVLLAPCYAFAAFDEFADGYSPRNFELRSGDVGLVIKGEVELELHDIEGEGGPGFDSATDKRTIGTRSPFVEIDSFWLALRFELPAALAINSVLEFTPRGAALGAVWADWRATGPQWLHHHGEAGFHSPFVKIDRRTERYPLSGTIYWREPELHGIYEMRAEFWRETAVELGLSVAMMRPITFAQVQESTHSGGTINIVAYGPARTFSGNSPVVGGRLLLESHGAFVSAFGYVGSLAAEAGTDELRSGMSAYRDLPGYNAATPALQLTTFNWYGARVGFDGFGLHALVEAIQSRESLLRRYGGYAQVSYAWRLPHDADFFHTVELLFRYEIYRVRGAKKVRSSGRALRSPAVSEAATWDWDVATLALICRLYRRILTLRLEYYVIAEQNGVPALGIPNAPFRNDEALLQLEARF